MAKEIERWVTINGKRVPIYADGSMGGFMKGKSHKPKKDSVNKTDEDFMEKENKRWEKEHGEWKDHAQGKNYQELVDKLKEGGFELESADAHDIQNSEYFNDEKVTLYDKDDNEYEGTYNRYSDGGREVVDIKPKSGKSNTKSAEPEGKHASGNTLEPGKEYKEKTAISALKHAREVYGDDIEIEPIGNQNSLKGARYKLVDGNGKTIGKVWENHQGTEATLTMSPSKSSQKKIKVGNKEVEVKKEHRKKK